MSRTRTTEMSVRVLTSIEGEPAKQLYDLYRATFGELAVRAANRHVLTEDEFMGTMSDERIDKYLVHEDGASESPLGLLTLTNHLETVTWVSADYYTHHFPEYAERDAVYYLGFAMVGPHRHREHAFSLLARRITDELLAKGAMCAFDICRYNIDVVGLDEVAQAMLGEFGEVRAVDTQTYYAAVPYPATGLPETPPMPGQRAIVEGAP